MCTTGGDRSARRRWGSTWAIPLTLLVGLSIGLIGGWLGHRGGIGLAQSVTYEGKLSAKSDNEVREVVQIYYPRPFVNRPTLEVNFPQGFMTILEERNDGFKIQCNPVAMVTDIQWRARGEVAR